MVSEVEPKAPLQSWTIMQVIYGLDKLKQQREKAVATIGIFDGAHIGHKGILREVVKQARKKRRIAAVLTFYPHPKKVLAKAHLKSTIISLGHRLRLLETMGIDLCVVIRFTSSFSKKSAEWFIRHILFEKLKTETLIVGSKFKLGKDKISAQRLKKLATRYGLNLKIIPAIKYKGNIVSSSLIRNLIEKGKLDLASKLLGRSVAVYGTVVSGRRRGRVVGFRTANINPHHEVIPPCGVYAVWVLVDKRYYKGLLNIGFRPTFETRQREPAVEVHVLNFHGNLYNKPIEIYFIKKIRAEKRFRSKEALQTQIKKDILYASRIFSSRQYYNIY